MHSTLRTAAGAALVPALLLLAMAGLAGCKKETPAPPPTGAAGPPAAATSPLATASQTYRTVQFERPRDWVAEEKDQPDGLQITAPSDAEGDAPNVFMEINESPAGKELGQILDEEVPALAARKNGFALKSKAVLTHPSGSKYARLEYATDREGTGWTQIAASFPVKGNKRLVIQAFAPTAQWAQYGPVFNALIDSIKIPS